MAGVQSSWQDLAVMSFSTFMLSRWNPQAPHPWHFHVTRMINPHPLTQSCKRQRAHAGCPESFDPRGQRIIRSSRGNVCPVRFEMPVCIGKHTLDQKEPLRGRRGSKRFPFLAASSKILLPKDFLISGENHCQIIKFMGFRLSVHNRIRKNIVIFHSLARMPTPEHWGILRLLGYIKTYHWTTFSSPASAVVCWTHRQVTSPDRTCFAQIFSHLPDSIGWSGIWTSSIILLSVT